MATTTITKSDFAKQVIARQISEAINSQRIVEAEKITREAEMAKPKVQVE